MRKRTIAKEILLGLAVSAGLVLALAAVVLFINRNDAAPSPAASAFTALLLQRPVVAAQDNSYLYLMGMDSARGQDPQAAGERKVAELEAAASAQALATMGANDTAYRALRSADVEALSIACGKDSGACGLALEKDPQAVTAWRTSEQWLHARYQALLGRGQWRASAVSYEPDAPFPPVSLAADGQSLHFLAAWQDAGRGDAAAVRAALDADLRFWRAVFAQSDSVLTKMVAATALRRHFALGNMVLRRLPADQQAAALPAQWRQPISIAEKSLRLAIAGELKALDIILRTRVDGTGNSAIDQRWLQALRPVFKVQASMNHIAEGQLAFADALDVDYKDLPQALEREHQRRASPAQKPTGFSLYNVMGNVMTQGGIADLTPYAARAADLEGIRRIHLLAVELRGEATANGEIVERVAGTALKDPYSGQPFAWNAAQEALVFQGLEPGQQGKHMASL
jgi:hypothetical protein